MGRLHPIAMTWHDLAFFHWPLPPSDLRPMIPAALELDTFDGQAWLGIVPFAMTGVGYPVMRHLPAVSRFLELNVRTYVRKGEHAGVWFFSLDAASRLAVWFCRNFFFLPYYFAGMKLEKQGETCRYESRREAGGGMAFLNASYAPAGPVYQTSPGNLDHWLTNRLCLFSQDHRQRLYRCDIQHPPWPLQPGDGQIRENSMEAPLGISLPDVPPLIHFSKKLQVSSTHLIPLNG